MMSQLVGGDIITNSRVGGKEHDDNIKFFTLGHFYPFFRVETSQKEI